MATILNAQYLCPLCQSPLSQNALSADTASSTSWPQSALSQDSLSQIKQSAARSLRCEKNHSFDIAKEGYINLLPVQHKHSKDPGDNKAMVNARRAFLDKGFYQPLASRVTELYQQYIEQVQDKQNIVLDAGCGEGFYTHQHKTTDNEVYGVDIAKNAVRIAAKKYKDCYFSVGTLSNLPFEGLFFDWIFSIYAPILEEEFTRVLADDGYLLTVTPAENHLFELKSLIYQDAKQHDTEKSPIKALSLVLEERLSYQMDFDSGEDLINLLAMTPLTFKTTPELLTELKNKSHFTCQADFLIRLYKK